MSTKKRTQAHRAVRGSISRESLADAALLIADREGFEAVTLRAIASEVGASAMAPYTYFANKEDLFVAMRERAFGQIRRENMSQTTWQALLEGMARGVSRSIREHPNWLPLFSQTGAPPPAALGFLDRLFELMFKDGFSFVEALRAYTCVMSFALGGVLLERTLTGGAGADLIAKRLALLQQLVAQAPAGRYASLGSVAAQIDRWSFEEAFEFGIKALLAGIESQGGPASGRTVRGADPRRREAEQKRR
ncbi:MAG TPA: TetR/AcrR family transcriptional regulator [Polyangiaceae bacterium]|nr:TetR/AcrR family transcriptional regulator [Polyangiaceae bacterium]